MHASVQAWFREVLTADEVSGKTVLEVGSCDVNGSVRPYIESLDPGSYVGVDAAPGPRVDQVVRCDDLVSTLGADCADIVVCTEMLEHVFDWRGCVWNLLHAVRPGGLLLVTTRSDGFPYHPYPEDHWRYSVEAMGEILSRGMFEVLTVKSDPQPRHPGVFAKARKPLGWSRLDSASIWSGVTVTQPVRSTSSMKQSTQSGWYTDKAGNEVFVKQGTVRPDSHPDVVALGAVFADLDVEEAPPAKSRAKSR